MSFELFFLVLILLMLVGVPVSFSMALDSAGYMIAMGTDLSMVVQRMGSGADSFRQQRPGNTSQ